MGGGGENIRMIEQLNANLSMSVPTNYDADCSCAVLYKIDSSLFDVFSYTKRSLTLIYGLTSENSVASRQCSHLVSKQVCNNFLVRNGASEPGVH